MSYRMPTRAALRALTVGSTLVAGACRDESTPTQPAGPPPGPGARQLSPAPSQRPALDPQVGYAREIPGFGGVFLDRNGTPTVYLKDVRQRPAAERALAAELGAVGAAPAQLRVVQGAYDYLELDDWLSRVAPEALAVPGAVYVDADEASNRLRIGVETPAADAAVRGLAARLGVPTDAVVVETTEPVRLASTVRENLSPERGGFQIQGLGVGTCSLGFNTWPANVITYRFFVTASHCTKVRSAVDGTNFYQPTTISSANLIGTEVTDPPFFTYATLVACPPGRKCRWSDAARVRYAATPTVDLGGIARTTGVGSITVDAANPVFNITAEQGSPLQFTVLHKVGRTTGWTKGLVINTCTAVNVSDSSGNDTGITMLCQDRVAASSGPGDSGSPVFSWSGSGSNVTLYGILWGGNSDGTKFVFSRMANIEYELGAMRTY
jgi:hypothetical protein